MRMRASVSAAPSPDALQKLEMQGSSTDTLHLLCPAGIGDFAWIWAKFSTVARERKLKFLFPEQEQHRADQYCELVGADCGYIDGLNTQWVWRQAEMPDLPKRGGVISLHANRYLETGRHLSSWYPELPLIYPKIKVPVSDTDVGDRGYVLVFTCHAGYMRGNLQVSSWVRVCKAIEKSIGRVRFVGAGADVPFAKEIRHFIGGDPEDDLFNCRLGRVISASRRAEMFVGVAGGPLIIGLMENCPSYFFYPLHLTEMPGSWEPPDSPWGWCHVREAEERVLEGAVEELYQDVGPRFVHKH